MKKILYITTLSRTINAFLVPHIKALIDEGYLVDCACCVEEHIELSKELLECGVRFYDIPFSRNPLGKNNIDAYKQLINIQKENNYDIVHVHTPIASIYGRLLKVKFPNLKTIYTAHGFHFHKGAPFLNWAIYYPIERIMSKFTDVIITMNEEDYERAKTFNIDKVYKVNGVGLDLDYYNGNLFDKSEVRKKLGLSDDDFVLCMIAEVNKNKNHKQMIDAIKLLKDKGTEVKVICAGDGPLMDSIKEYIKKLGLEENIYMLGHRSDVNELIVACDAGILMSYREGLPRNIMEFMACGKPVIGTNIRGVKDIVNHRYNGFLVGINNIKSTAKTIEYILENKNRLNYIYDNSLKEANKYSYKNIINSLITYY